MSSRTGKQEETCSVAWLMQSGRSRVQRNVISDGYRGDYPYAGVVVVAENRTTEDDLSASIFVETVRDVFAEGVAFGVEDVLKDSFKEADEIIINKQLLGCSGAAIVYSGSHIWYALTGSCRIYKIDSDGINCIVFDQTEANSSRLTVKHPEFSKKIHELSSYIGSGANLKIVCGHARVKDDTSYIVLTAAGWIQLEKATPATLIKGIGKSLSGWLAVVSRDLKLAYRRQGGALACVSGIDFSNRSSIKLRYAIVVLLVIALLSFLIFGDLFSCNSKLEEQTDLFLTDSIIEEIIQPLEQEVSIDSESTSNLFEFMFDSLSVINQDLTTETTIDISEFLPVEIVQVGGVASSLSVDSFKVSINSEPDIQWENFSPGIYVVKTDSVALILSEIVSSKYPALEIFKLDRIITVRETGVAESASWLSSLSSVDAQFTAVIVETRSSVAGGADWIRNYAVFSNGNRAERSGEAGGFVGDSLPNIPVLRNSNSYRIIVIL